MTTDSQISKLYQMLEAAQKAGGEDRLAKHKAAGKMTARERINALLDQGSFQEIDTFVTHRANSFGMADRKPLGDGVVTGYGTVEGRLVYVFAEDFTVLGGSLGEAHADKICKLMDLAMKTGAPVVGIEDSGGARIQEGVNALEGYGRIFTRNTLASGVIPQISVIMGACAGGAVYSPALTDFVVMVKDSSHMFITGPDVIRAVTHEDVTFEELGGAMAHSTTSGVAHFAADNEAQALETVRKLLGYLPANNLEDPPYIASKDNPGRLEDKLNTILPSDTSQPYDVKNVIKAIVDDGAMLEVHAGYAGNLVTAFARLDGAVVGIVANQPAVMAGTLDINAADKGARFVRVCDAFNVPIITLVDAPGFMPGVNQEHGGIIRHGAKMIYAYCEATVPKLTVITRKAYGGAYIVMSSKNVRSDLNYAWPGAEIAVMGPDGAVNIIFRKEIAEAANPDAKRAELVEAYRSEFANPYVAAARGYIDAVIEPKETRTRLINGLRMLANKRDSLPTKKHGNIPL
ncbi:MAG: acyl-CoA carboxylase subunit beta [Chloroflexi bacterium]|nr:acyl-CoA carboxylase subunit beta [Chloroflexota bacterium]